jgi:peptidoglycan/xylan/chitin deacetylase (PgdA/CDA1 family)
MFHHFHDDINYHNPQGGGSISAIEFNSIIDYIDENYNLITPDEYIHKVNNNDIQQVDICLTFDDSLKCQFDIIYPELEKRSLKAFFFVYSGAFLENPPLLEFFRDFRLNFFTNVDEYYELFFDSVSKNHIKEYSNFLTNYKVDYLSSYPFYTNNDRKYRFLRDKVLNEKYFDVVLRMMEAKDYSISTRKEYLFMSIDNLKKLHESSHTIGLHSHSHPTTMQKLSFKEQLDEYSKNYDFIYSITNQNILSMSHPCGNYNEDTLRVLKKLGIKVGFRPSLTPSNIKSALEIPREDHTNIINIIRKN